jgi:hypothetical protein
MSAVHIRKNVRICGQRLLDHGSPGETLCGASIGSRDLAIRDARLDKRQGWRFVTCARCRVAMDAEINGGEGSAASMSTAGASVTPSGRTSAI